MLFVSNDSLPALLGILLGQLETNKPAKPLRHPFFLVEINVQLRMFVNHCSVVVGWLVCVFISVKLN